MNKISILLIFAITLCLCTGCAQQTDAPQIAATTLPVYEFTDILCQGTGLTVGKVVTESVSCLHDYTLQVGQMRMLENAQAVVISGAGLEEFLEDALENSHCIIDASHGAHVHEGGHDAHEGHGSHDSHSHSQDPHIWLSPENAQVMACNICKELCRLYPQHTETFQRNLETLSSDLDALQQYGEDTLSQLSCRELITFHDGFAYFAESFGLTILRAIEEESGSEASAAELKELILLTREHQIPALFTERNGSTSAAEVIAAETGAAIFPLDMAMAGDSYFDAMYHNIRTIKEALG